MSILIITTGGTIDKLYRESDGSLYFGDSQIPAALKQGRYRPEVTLESFLKVDSLDMSAEQREALIQHIAQTETEKIVVTHGTDTMVETALAIQAQKLTKTVVLTGAMIPLSMRYSDGLFNLGGALTAASVLPHGVYLSCNGEVFPADQVKKNRVDVRFEPK